MPRPRLKEEGIDVTEDKVMGVLVEVVDAAEDMAHILTQQVLVT